MNEQVEGTIAAPRRAPPIAPSAIVDKKTDERLERKILDLADWLENNPEQYNQFSPDKCVLGHAKIKFNTHTSSRAGRAMGLTTEQADRVFDCYWPLIWFVNPAGNPIARKFKLWRLNLTEWGCNRKPSAIEAADVLRHRIAKKVDLPLE